MRKSNPKILPSMVPTSCKLTTLFFSQRGRSHTIPALDAEISDVRLTYETNVFGPMAMCSKFIHLLIAARGLIINISSVSSIVPYLFAGIYSSTKGALNTYSRVLRMELRPFKVRVMVAMTGTVKSNFTSHSERSLPADSLYMPANDKFIERLTFSQKNSTMPTQAYASDIATQALKGEGILGGWVGRTPDWYWAGGLSTIGWLASMLPWRISEAGTAIFFQMADIGKLIARTREKKQ